MSDERVRSGESGLLSVVGEARARLARIAGRAYLRDHAWWVLGAGAAASACRPWVWRLAADAPLWTGIGRALALFSLGSAAAVAALIVAGRRQRPTEIGAARAIDEGLGTAEVIASGLAFVRDGRSEPVVMIARRRAAECASSVRVPAMFPLPSLRPSVRGAVAFGLCTTLAVGVGGYERGLANALLTPPTASESVAAKALEAAAIGLVEQQAKDAKEPAPPMPASRREKSDAKLGAAGPALADKAKEAARAAKRGDRRGALEKLEELRSAGAQRSAHAGDMRATLRKMAEAMSPPSSAEKAGAGKGAGANPATPSQDAAESMRLLAEKMRSPEGGAAGSGADSNARVLERLERAAEEARRAGGEGKSNEANEAARALSRAAESLRRGDREAASQALAQAAERAAAMDQARAEAASEAMAIMEMLEKSGALERAIQLALLGQDGQGEGVGEKGEGQGRGGEGECGEGEGKGGQGGKPGGRAAEMRRAILARLAAMGAAESPEGNNESPGSGPHMPDRHRSKRAPLPAQGSIRAPGQVGEGPRAIQAISGLGRGTEPPAEYREVFPSYDAAAEEGLADERIPAERRAAVRRYFQSIRPEPSK